MASAILNSLYRSRISKYFCVRLACFSSASIFLLISNSKSSTRSKSACVDSSLLSVSVFRALYFDTPAACSNIFRRAFSLSERMSSTMPSAMIAYEFEPIPVSIKRLVMSLRRHGTLLRRYSDSPLRYKIRVIVTV